MCFLIDYLKIVNNSFKKLFLLSFLFIFTFSLYISFLETPDTRLYSNLVLVFINIIVLIGIFYAAKYTKKFDNKYFYVWGFLEISVILWILGDFLWTLQDQNIFVNMNLILFFYALRTIFLCLSIFSIPRSFTSPLVRLKERIDILIIIVSVTMVLWSVLLYPLIITNKVNIGIIIFNTALYFILIFLIISRLTYNYSNLRKNPLLLILASASVQLMAAIIFGYRISLNILNELRIEDFFWVTASLLLLLASIYQIKELTNHKEKIIYETRLFNLRYGRYLIPVLIGTIYALVLIEYYFKNTISPIIVYGGSALVLLIFTRQIVDNRIIEESNDTLQKSNDTYYGLLNSVPDPIFVQNKNGEFLETNKSATDIYGYKKNEIIGKTPDLLQVNNKSLDKVRVYFNKALEGDNQSFKCEGKGKDGSIFPNELKLSKGVFFGEEVVITLVRNISERKKFEEALIKSENKYRTVFENTGTAIIIVEHDQTISLINKKTEEIFGCKKEKIEGKKKWTEFVYSDSDLEMMKEYNSKRLKDPSSAPDTYEIKMISNNIVKDVLLTITTIPGTKQILGSIIDITDNKKAHDALKKSEEKFRLMAENIEEIFFMTDPINRKILYISPVNEKITGINNQTLYNDSLSWLELVHPDDKENVINYIESEVEINDDGVEYRIMKSDGSIRWLWAYPILLYDDNGQVYMVVGTIRDITNRKNAEKIIEDALNEKKVMLREIHHRVKNNMQIIISLLNLQSAYIDDNNIKKTLLETQSRVKSMSMVHEKLYSSDKLSDIYLNSYLNDLCNQILSMYSVTDTKLKYKIEFEPCIVDINIAIPLGLVMNEILTNSIKYAFPEPEMNPLINLKLYKKDDSIFIIISDNGIGLPKDLNISNSGTLGLQLIETLIVQIEGELEVNNDNGTEFRIKFPA